MARYKLLNDSTHSIIYTDSEKKKDQLLQRGFHISDQKVAETREKGKGKRRKTVNSEQ